MTLGSARSVAEEDAAVVRFSTPRRSRMAVLHTSSKPVSLEEGARTQFLKILCPHASGPVRPVRHYGVAIKMRSKESLMKYLMFVCTDPEPDTDIETNPT